MTILNRNDNIISSIYYLKSYAKINLTLTVTGKNAQGYHLLKSLFSYIDLHDIITIQQNSNNSPSFKVGGNFFSSLKNDFDSMNDNLIIKAIKKMHEKYNIPTNFDIYLDKRIPVASGMGGGSSNAAVIIRFLNDFFDLQLSQKELNEIGVTIGADVPFFLQNKSSVCENSIGDIIFPVKYDETLYGVLIYCGFKSATGLIFKELVKNNKGFYNKPEIDYDANSINKDDVLKIIKQNSNDLLKPAILFNSSIGKVLNFLNNHNLPIVSGMSGAGPTCFSICKNIDDCNKLMFNLKSEFNSFFVKKVQFLPNIEFETILPSSYPDYESIIIDKKNQNVSFYQC